MSTLFLQRFVATFVCWKLALVVPWASGGIDKLAMHEVGQAEGSSIVQAPSSRVTSSAKMDRTKVPELALFSHPGEA